MDHKSLLKSLDAQTRATITRKSDLAGLRHLAIHIGWILLFGTYVAKGAPLWGLALMPLGICIIFLFTLLHETVHFTPFESKFLNRLAGHFCSILVVVPNQWFGHFHLWHHKYTNDPENDPELEVRKPQNIRDYIWHISGLPFWKASLALLFRHARGDVAAPYLPKRAGRICVWQARGMVLFYFFVLVLIAMGWSALFWCWMVPIVLGQPFLRLYLLAEHGHCPAVANMFENTRTTFTNRAVRFLAWNMPYHAEHHAYPAVPFHKLPELHALTHAHLKSTSDGYSGFHKDYVKAL